uniref:Cytochrome c oxidase assembly protein COX11, mitochondrial n=1 Tax=Anthurium amnicola TaxID=1678845 RepID=A0A1D1Z7H4_9ARAE
MVGASYAAVPPRTGASARPPGTAVPSSAARHEQSVEEKIALHARDGTSTSREIVVQFNADVADGMPWKFIPTQREVRVKPAESALAFYTAENQSSTPIIGVSTYNATPHEEVSISLMIEMRLICLIFCWPLFTSIRYNASALRNSAFS